MYDTSGDGVGCFGLLVVIRVCLYIYMLLGSMTGSWKILSGPESLEFILGQTVETL